jgi:hypothetical protein
VFLIDESESLREYIAGGTKSKAESIATAINSLLNQLAGVPNLELAIAGYRNDGSNGADVGCRWAGPLAGRRFVSSWHLADNPVAVETRVRKLPVPNKSGQVEESIRFPIWYVPQLGGGIFPVIGYGYCQHLVVSGVTEQTAWVKPPLVVSFVGDWMSQQTELAVERVLSLESPAGPPVLMHVHLGGIGGGRPVLYPSTDQHLTTDAQKVMFRWSSVLPDYMLAALREGQVSVVPGAKALIYNATVADLIRLLGLVKAYAASLPVGPASPSMPPAVRSAPRAVVSNARAGSSVAPKLGATNPASVSSKSQALGFEVSQIRRALVVMLLDRSMSDPVGASQRKIWSRLPDQINDMLSLIGKKGLDCLDAALITYGMLPSGKAELRTQFEGPLAGKTIASAAELATGAMRTDEVPEKIPNGIGGIISFNRKRQIFVDMEPLAQAPAAEAVRSVIDIIRNWRGDRPAAEYPAVVVHHTRGCFCGAAVPSANDAGGTPALQAALAALHEAGAILYHHIVTESPHRSLSYPDTAGVMNDPHLVQLWNWSSPLLGVAALSAEKKVASPAARGIVVNAKFDLLLDGILAACSANAPANEPANVTA